MENASKALIIAGAILLSILLIGLGMAVYNNASSSSANADLSSQEVNSFNSTFEAYEGRQKGTAVRRLITAIQSSNAKNEDRTINLPGAVTQNSYESNKTYTVKFNYDGPGGLINSVEITERATDDEP